MNKDNVKLLTETVDKFVDEGWDDLTYEQQSSLLKALTEINNEVKKELAELET